MPDQIKNILQIQLLRPVAGHIAQFVITKRYPLRERAAVRPGKSSRAVRAVYRIAIRQPVVSDKVASACRSSARIFPPDQPIFFR